MQPRAGISDPSTGAIEDVDNPAAATVICWCRRLRTNETPVRFMKKNYTPRV